jgi:hypothetical protein
MAIKNFNLADSDIALIEKKAKDMGESSDSAALRVIIREWAKSYQVVSTSTLPTPCGGEQVPLVTMAAIDPNKPES